MTVPYKNSYHHGDLKRALIESATKLTREGTVAQPTVKDLAADVGVTSAAFYRHFTSVDELLAEVRIEGLELFEAAERAALERAEGNSVSRVEVLIRAYVQFAQRNPGHFRIMTDSSVARRPNGNLRNRPALGLVVDAIADGLRRGEIAKGNPKDLAIAAWAAVHGLAGLFAYGPLRDVLDNRKSRAKQLEDVLVGLICRGLSASLDRPTRPAPQLKTRKPSSLTARRDR